MFTTSLVILTKLAEINQIRKQRKKLYTCHFQLPLSFLACCYCYPLKTIEMTVKTNVSSQYYCKTDGMRGREDQKMRATP